MSSGRDVNRGMLFVEQLSVGVVDGQPSLGSDGLEGAVDGTHLMSLVVVDELYGLQGLANGIVGGRGTQVVVVELPVEARTGTVEHPLYDARSPWIVVAEGLEHGPCAVVADHRALTDEVVQIRCFAITLTDGLGEHSHTVELCSGSRAMIVYK